MNLKEQAEEFKALLLTDFNGFSDDHFVKITSLQSRNP
jgi:hypothetical protein